MPMQVVHSGPQAAPIQVLIPRDRLLRLPDTVELSGAGKSTIYSLMKEGKFPPTIRITSRMVGWSENAVLQWVQDRINGVPTSAQALTSFTTVQGVQA